MVFPLGYEPNDSGGDVFQLQKTLYGLKQSSKILVWTIYYYYEAV